MYTSYWGLRERPFENTPDPRFLYQSQQHKEALARMLYVVHQRKGGFMLTGEYGSGKTLLTRVLWQELQQEHIFQTAFILNPRLSGLELIQEIANQLSGEAPPNSKIELFHLLHKIFYANYNAGRHSVVVIDEAQAIKDEDIFEELRLLLNFQLEQAFLLSLVILGQPELRYTMMHLPQLTQRLAASFHLKRLNCQETREYILHRLSVAGASSAIFSDDAYELIYSLSQGTPRIINNICDLALLVGFGNSEKVIGKKLIEDVGEDLSLRVIRDKRYHRESGLDSEALEADL